MRTSSDWPAPRLVDDVADLLRERILAGRIAAGAPLSQRQLAVELGVSRTVVGDALRELRWEGVVAVAPSGRRLRVAGDDDDQSIVASAYAVREVIDGLAARLAAAGMGPKVRAVLDMSLEEQRAALSERDLRAYARADLRFHGQILEASGNQLLSPHMALLRSTARGALRLAPQRLEEAIEEHRAIRDAICERDASRAEVLARAHVRSTMTAAMVR